MLNRKRLRIEKVMGQSLDFGDSEINCRLGNANPGFLNPGFAGLTGSKPGFPGTRVYLCQSGGRPVLTVSLQLVVTCQRQTCDRRLTEVS